MEEFLIPTETEPAGFSPAGPPKSTLERLNDFIKSTFTVSVREYVKEYIKRNGLLTLSVMAVITGFVLGFMLRGLTLSTQVFDFGFIY